MTSFDTGEVDFHWGVRIPLRDGIHLNATLYTPKGLREPAPCIFVMTPYISDGQHERGVYFARRGLPFASVDVRGRGNSEGTFRPRIQEAQDGYDIVEWLARQPYCNGKVAMCGGSYLGYSQWATAKEFPPHLATIVPTAAPYVGLDIPMRNNIFYPFRVRWLALTGGKTSQANIYADQQLWTSLYRDWNRSGRPFREIDSLLGNPSATFQLDLTHPEPDAHWDAYNPTAEQYTRLRIPILTITGAYDGDQPGALEHYRQHLRNASPEASARHWLVIGPWDHSGTMLPRRQFGGLELGPQGLLDVRKLHREWYAWTMQDGPQPEFLQRHVAYYVTGAERWRYAHRLEDVTANQQAYFLDSYGRAEDVFSSGTLTSSPGKGPPDRYRYDPADTTGLELEVAPSLCDGGSLVDQSVMLTLSGKALFYHSAPFEADTEISGFFKLCLWMSIDCLDADFHVSVYEIALDGSSVQLSTDAMRARYREGLRTPQLIRTREPLCYHFERFPFISRKVMRGHRLRLMVTSSNRLVDGGMTQKNYNGGGVVSEESAKDARPVTVTVFHRGAYSSVLYVPIGQPESDDEPVAPMSAFLEVSQ